MVRDRLALRGVANPLGADGLWRRLVFQYHLRHELPHKHIFERTQPPAALGDYAMTMGKLNVWLSNHRLAKELERYICAEVVDAR